MSAPIADSAARTSTYSAVPPASRMRGWPRSTLNLPFSLMTPVRNSSATASIRPEPQIPLARCCPIVTIIGSSVSGLMRTVSIAPITARIPCLTEPPSKAGPAEQAHESSHSALPSAISPLVPMSMKSVSLSLRKTPEASSPAVMSPPT